MTDAAEKPERGNWWGKEERAVIEAAKAWRNQIGRDLHFNLQRVVAALLAAEAEREK